MSVASDPSPTGAGSTVLPGVPLPEWARGRTEPPGRSATDPRGTDPHGTDPLPTAGAVLPLPMESQPEEVIAAAGTEEAAGLLPAPLPTPIARGRHRRLSA